MDDPGLAWPAWKFGMKRDAIYTTLHDQYNTFQSTIQDPDAFQHDVHEIASEAASTAEFHNMLGQRRELRLNELNNTLESASYEIIANPMLVGTKQWEHALQLFRTRSLDSLVRYFASYLPSDHQWYQPKSAHLHDVDVNDLPPSPRSITTYSDDMETSAHDPGRLRGLNTMSSYTDSDTEAGDDEHENHQGENSKNENKNEKHAAVDAKTTANTVTVENAHDDTKSTDTVTFDDDDCSSQSSGPDTPDSMSDAEPDVDVTDDDVHDHGHSHGHGHGRMDHHIQHFKTPSPKVSSDTAAQAAAAATSPNLADKQKQPTLTRRSPLQSGFAVDVTRCSSPMPSPLPLSLSQLLPVSAAVRSRQRSMSPSRPFPLVCAHAVDQTDDNDYSTHEHGRGVGRLSRSRLASVQSQRLANRSPTQNSRRRPGVGACVGVSTKIEKTPTPLPRPMRTRLRERREAAAATIQRD